MVFSFNNSFTCRDPSSGRPSSCTRKRLSSPSLCREKQPQVGSLLLLGREQLRNEIILSYIR